MKVNWMYHRKSCETCKKADDFFAKHQINIETIVDTKAAYKLPEALALLQGAERLLSTKGTKVRELDLKTKPSTAEIEEYVIGPTGKLRAPTLKIGKTMVVGFNESMYKEVLGLN